MKIINLIQGTPEWNDHRAKHYNASDAPAMMGVSKYKSRSQLIKERATGIIPEVDDATQRRFNDGHRFEALARPLAEKIIGEELSPITGTEGKYSASFDGITFDGDVILEHKTLNADLRETLTRGEQPADQYLIQMEHQLMVSGAEKCLFMASSWDADGNLIEEVHQWYLPNAELRKRIIAGWEQFEKDVAAYVPTEEEKKAEAEAIVALPSVFVQATGMVTASNLDEFKVAATAFIANINTELTTDQHFADAESTVKFCKDAESNIDQVKKNITGQMSSVDEVLRTLDHISAQLRDKRLMLDKLVKSEKDKRKLQIVSSAIAKFDAHLASLEAEIVPIKITGVKQNFAEAIKGLKSLKSMQDAVATALANAKIALDTEATDIRKKLAWCKDNAAGHSALFPDLQTIIVKPFDDFTLTITSRIEKAKAEEAEREAAIMAKAEAEARAKVEAEAQAKAEAEKQPAAPAAPVENKTAAYMRDNPPPSPESKFVQIDSIPSPSRATLVRIIAAHYGVGDALAEKWLRDEFAEVAA